MIKVMLTETIACAIGQVLNINAAQRGFTTSDVNRSDQTAERQLSDLLNR